MALKDRNVGREKLRAVVSRALITDVPLGLPTGDTICIAGEPAASDGFFVNSLRGFLVQR